MHYFFFVFIDVFIAIAIKIKTERIREIIYYTIRPYTSTPFTSSCSIVPIVTCCNLIILIISVVVATCFVVATTSFSYSCHLDDCGT